MVGGGAVVVVVVEVVDSFRVVVCGAGVTDGLGVVVFSGVGIMVALLVG